MRSRKSRQQIRNLTRNAESPAPAPRPARPEEPALVQQVRCACNQILRLSSAHNGKRCSCPTCDRKFLISVSGSVAAGNLKISLVYVSASMKTGHTFMAEPSNDAVDVPDQLPATCTCGRTLPAKRSMYDKRVR